MKIDNTNKLEFFKDLYTMARGKQEAELMEMENSYNQYKGTYWESDSMRPTSCRNITYEFIEAQRSNYIPPSLVTPRMTSTKTLRNARMLEHLCANVRDFLPFEKLNDQDELTTYVRGSSVWLIEWDNSKRTHNTVGDVKITLLKPDKLTVQPYVYNIDDMDYLFIEVEDTKDNVCRKYGVTLAELEETNSENNDSEDTITIHTCFYKDEEGYVCKFMWADEVVLLDMDDYYNRKIYECETCGERKELCHCDHPVYKLVDEEYEELDQDIPLVDGMIPSVSPDLTPDGQMKMEDVAQPVFDEQTGEQLMEMVNGLAVPLMQTVQLPKMKPTRLPFYKPNKFPVVIRKNISKEESVFGQSDAEILRGVQKDINKIETRLKEKMTRGGVIPVLPASIGGISDQILSEGVIIDNPSDKAMIDKIDMQPNVTQDIATADRLYQVAQRLVGITDSYMGQSDPSARSGVAKQIQVSQSAGRLESKRRMKNAAYAEIDEIIFQLYLAYADEPRPICYRDEFGDLQNEQFNRYEFLTMDDKGEWYYDDQYMFSTDATANAERSREYMWQENRTNLQSGAYGDPTNPETILNYWQLQEKCGYPYARLQVERCKQKVAEYRMMMQQQMAMGMPPQESNDQQPQLLKTTMSPTNKKGNANYMDLGGVGK